MTAGRQTGVRWDDPKYSPSNWFNGPRRFEKNRALGQKLDRDHPLEYLSPRCTPGSARAPRQDNP